MAVCTLARPTITMPPMTSSSFAFPPKSPLVRSIHLALWQSGIEQFVHGGGQKPVSVYRVLTLDDNKWLYTVELVDDVPHCVTRLNDDVVSKIPAARYAL
jgi:hypothetical protein